MKIFSKQYIIYFIPFLLVLLVFYKQILHPFSVTFNFADNWGYLSQIVSMRQYFTGDISIDFGHVFVPLYSFFIFIFGFLISDIFLLNFLYIGHIILAWFGGYFLFLKLSHNRCLSLLGSTVFAFNSLTLYSNWFNLMGLAWIPFSVLSLLDKKNNGLKMFLFSSLLLLSGHYYFLTFTVILFSFVLYELLVGKNLINFFKRNIFPIILSLFFSITIYLIPILFFQTSGEIQKFAEINKVYSQAIDVQYLFTPNQFNHITSTYGQYLPGFGGPLRGSNYLGIISILLFISSIFFIKKVKIRKFFYIIFVVSIVLFFGGSLVIFGNEFIQFLPFKLFEIFGLSGVFRKSSYFFYLLSFSIGGIIALSKLKIKSFFIILLLALGIVFENNVSFDRAIHTYQDFSFEDQLDKTATILALPNTGYSIGKYKYLFYEKGYNILKYPDASIPYGKGKYDYLYNDCFLNSLIFNKEKVGCKNTKPDISFFKKRNIKQIILFKKHQVVYFFHDSGDKINHYYTNAKKKIDFYPKFFEKYIENNDYTIYNIIGMFDNPEFYTQNLIYKNKSFKTILLNINLKNEQNLILRKVYSRGWKLYLEPYLKIDCRNPIIYKNIPKIEEQKFTYYIVQAGDSFERIAKKYKISAENIKEANPNWDRTGNGWLEIGQVIKIPTKIDLPTENSQETQEKNSITECESENKFYIGGELSKLWKTPIFDETHKKVYDYANEWTLDADYIKANYPAEYYKENPDGSIDVKFTLYFKPQSYFYLGLIISISTFILLLLYLIISGYKDRKNKGNKN